MQGSGSANRSCIVTFDLVPNSGERIILYQTTFNASYCIMGDGNSRMMVSVSRQDSPAASTVRRWNTGSGIERVLSLGRAIYSECVQPVSVLVRAHIYATANGGSARVSFNAGEFGENYSFSMPVQTVSCL